VECLIIRLPMGGCAGHSITSGVPVLVPVPPSVPVPDGGSQAGARCSNC
jgi:hypothetical protein